MIVPTHLDGAGLRDAALDVLAERRDRVVCQGRRALIRRLLDSGSGTIDDVRSVVELPAGVGPKCFGAVPRALVKAVIIAAAGFAQTSRPTAHARPVAVWRLVDRAAAERWLAENPDPPIDNDQGTVQSTLWK